MAFMRLWCIFLGLFQKAERLPFLFCKGISGMIDMKSGFSFHHEETAHLIRNRLAL
jgi:hypothetical protein